MRTRTGVDIDGAFVTSDVPISVAAGGRGWTAGCGDDGEDLLVLADKFGSTLVIGAGPAPPAAVCAWWPMSTTLWSGTPPTVRLTVADAGFKVTGGFDLEATLEPETAPVRASTSRRDRD